MVSIAISGEKNISPVKLQKLIQQTQYPLLESLYTPPNYLLYQTKSHVELRSLKNKQMKPVFIDFLSGKLHHRRLSGVGKKQAIARAMGLKKYKNPTVIDATAGLGRDSFVLALLGCQMTLLEQSPIIYVLLKDAVQRVLSADDQALIKIFNKINLYQTDSIRWLKQLTMMNYPEVIYLDPMFPKRTKSALVKKDMQFFHDLIPANSDDKTLLKIALQRAKKRVVVKRPKSAMPLLSTPKVNFSIQEKSIRYDVYLVNKL